MGDNCEKINTGFTNTGVFGPLAQEERVVQLVREQRVFGGTIRDPDNISEDVTFRIRFDRGDGALIERIDHGQNTNNVKADVFYGLRDDPWIRTTRIGRNVGAIVIEIPLNAVLKQHAAIFAWATTKHDDAPAPHELYGRPSGGLGADSSP